MSSFDNNPPKTALTNGITVQIGRYLEEILFKKVYLVYGIKRHTNSFNTTQIDHLDREAHKSDPRLELHYGDITNSTNLIPIIQNEQRGEKITRIIIPAIKRKEALADQINRPIKSVYEEDNELVLKIESILNSKHALGHAI